MPDDSNSNPNFVTIVDESAYSTGRPLTRGEIADARSVFGDAVDYTGIRVVDVGFDDARMAAFEGEIYAPESRYRDDFSSADTPLFDRATFLHEVTHIYQEQLGLDIADEMLRVEADGGGEYDKGYDYQLDPTKGFLDYNIEQQANIVRDYFGVSNGSAKPETTAQLLPAYRDLLPFDAFGGEQPRQPVVAPINDGDQGTSADTGTQADPQIGPIDRTGAFGDLGTQQQPRTRPINSDGSPVDTGTQPQTQPQVRPINPDGSPVDAVSQPQTGPIDPGGSRVDDGGQPQTEPQVRPINSDGSPVDTGAPSEPARAEPAARQEAGPTLADLLEEAGEELIDPNEERAVTQDEGEDQGTGGAGNEDDDDDAQGAGGGGSETPNPIDDGPSLGSGDFSVLVNRNAPYVNPGSGDFDLLTGGGDLSDLLNRNAPAINPGPGDFDLLAGGTDLSDLLDRNGPTINPGLIDFDMPPGAIDLSDLLDRNGPRQTFGADDTEPAGSTLGDDLVADFDFNADLDDFAGFEIV
jgi:hypothetical protein